MAQADWGSVQAHENTPQAGGGSVINWAGALMSLALIAGLAVWGYKLAVRDVSGVPVVRALDGPMRVQPEDPGGQAAAHQGLAVNNVQAEGQAEAPADRLALAPRPVELTDEDMPIDPDSEIITPVLAIRPSSGQSDIAAATEQVIAVALNEAAVANDPNATALALAEAIANTVDPLSEAVNEQVAAVTNAALQDLVASGVIPVSVPGVSASPRPVARPQDLSVQSTAPAASQVDREVAADTIPVGTRLVQLGAFDSKEVARNEWQMLAVRFEDYMSEKARVIEKAQSGGKTFYRLRAMGFADLSDARRFCSVLISANAACIPVVTR